MKFKALILAAAVIAQPLALMSATPSFAAATGGGGGGAGAGGGDPAGNSESVMSNGVCGRWDYNRAIEAIRHQQKTCTGKKSEMVGLLDLR